MAQYSLQKLEVNFVKPQYCDTRINLRMEFRRSCFATLRKVIKYSNNSA